MEIMRTIVKAGYTNQISLKELKTVIALQRGTDPRTVKNWVNALLLFDFLKHSSSHLFQVNLMEIPELIVEGVKKGQKKLM